MKHTQDLLLVHYTLLISILAFASCKQPHILMFLADDLGWNDVGYRNSEIHTPTLDHLAGNGVKLDNYYVQPICSPTRSQLLTGRYQIHTGAQHIAGVNSQPDGLAPEYPTLGDQLQGCGYKTHLVSKWHLGFEREANLPNNRGFDSFYGLLGGLTDYYTHTACIPVNGTPHCGLDFYNNSEPVRDKTGEYATEVYADRVVELVKEHSKQCSDKPLFILMSFQSPHTPLQVPEKYLQQYQHIANPIRRIYSGMVTAMDTAVDKIVNSFKDNGLWKDTIAVFSTDNGGAPGAGASNAPLKGGKASLWEGGVKAVGFVHGDMIKSKLKSTNQLIHVSDWFPTLSKLAKCSAKSLKLDGHDVWQSISKNKPSSRRELLYNIDPVMGTRGQVSQCDRFDTRIRAAIRVGKYKLLTGDPNSAAFIPDIAKLGLPVNNINFQFPDLSGPGEEDKNVWLYNIDEDPTESDDLSDKLPRVVQKLCNRLAKYNRTALPAEFVYLDSNGFPENNGGLWTHWLD